MIRFRNSIIINHYSLGDDSSFVFLNKQSNNTFVNKYYYQPGHKHNFVNMVLYPNYSNKLYLLPVVKLQSNRKLGTNFSYSDFYKLPIQFKHWTLKQLGYLVVEEFSRKNSKLLLKLSIFFIKNILKKLGKLTNFLSAKSAINFNFNFGFSNSCNSLYRSNKRKRSIRRSYRSRFFFSKKGRIWV